MSKAEYKPRYPKLHTLLSRTYKEAMKKGAEQARIEEMKSVIDTLNAIKDDGAVSIEFVRNFHNDIADIVGAADNQFRHEDLGRLQGVIAIAMEHLKTSFGGSTSR